MEVNIQEQSGKFTIVPKGSSGNSVGIRVTMDALREVNATGEAVGQTCSVKHSVNTFAAQDFTVAELSKGLLVPWVLRRSRSSPPSPASAAWVLMPHR